MAKREIPEINAGSMADIAFLLLIFFLVTTTMDKDQAYLRSIPKKVEVPPDTDIKVEQRNIFAIRANSNNELMVRKELMQNPDDISERVIEFYTKNEKVNDPSNDFPMYSRISMSEIESQLAAAESAAEEVENTPGASNDIIDFKWRQVTEWENKKKALKLYGKDKLPEIHFQAHVRIEVQQATEYKLFAKIQSELEEAIYQLRDAAALDVFGESYNVISRRYSMDKDPKDKDKMDLLKILYPDKFIEVTPKK
jgi:biopolymer transport protein ExbD